MSLDSGRISTSSENIRCMNTTPDMAFSNHAIAGSWLSILSCKIKWLYSNQR